MKNAMRPLQARAAYRDVLTMTQKTGAPQPMMATPKKAAQNRVRPWVLLDERTTRMLAPGRSKALPAGRMG